MGVIAVAFIVGIGILDSEVLFSYALHNSRGRILVLIAYLWHHSRDHKFPILDQYTLFR